MHLQQQNTSETSLLPQYLPTPDINFLKIPKTLFGSYPGYKFNTKGVQSIVENLIRANNDEHTIAISEQYTKEKEHIEFFQKVSIQAKRIFINVRFKFYVINEYNNRHMVIVPIPRGN